MKKTKTEYGYDLENETHTISVDRTYDGWKNKWTYSCVVENKKTKKWIYTTRVGEAKNIAKNNLV